MKLLTEQYWELNKQFEEYKEVCNWLDNSYWKCCSEYDKLKEKYEVAENKVR